MVLTLEQYISNPSKGVMTSTMREAARSNYIKKFNELLLREHSVINYFLYKDEKNNRFIARFKIPSEAIKNFYYDTVLEFTANNDVAEAGQNLFKYNVRFYSNDPAFVYQHAYSLKVNGMLIPEFERKMSQKALIEPAKEKNPYNLVLYIKTIYFAYLFMKLRSLNQLDKFIMQASDLNIDTVVGSVENADTKINERENAGAKLQKKKSAQLQKERKEKQESKNIKNTTKIKTTKTTGTIANTKFTKVSKKIKRK